MTLLRRGRRRSIATVLVGLALLVAVGFGYHRWSHPSVFNAVTSADRAIDTFDGRGAVEESMAYGMSYPHGKDTSTSVRIFNARPVVIENTSAATLRVVACSISRSAGIGAIGAVRSTNLVHECRRVVAARGATMHVSQGFSDQLVLEVTPHRTGVVRVRGLEVTYRAGWQRGRQHIGLGLRVRTP